jgi:hypothetical protein
MLSPRGGRSGNNRGFEFLLKYFVKHPIYFRNLHWSNSSKYPVISLLPVQIPHINVSCLLLEGRVYIN